MFYTDWFLMRVLILLMAAFIAVLLGWYFGDKDR